MKKNKVVICGAIYFALFLVFALWSSVGKVENLSRFIGFLVAAVWVPTTVIAYIESKSTVKWSWVKIAFVTLAGIMLWSCVAITATFR